MNDGHVQPVQSIAPGRRSGRLPSVVAAFIPIVVLIVVVAGGVLGGAGGGPGGAADEEPIDAEARRSPSAMTAEASEPAEPDEASPRPDPSDEIALADPQPRDPRFPPDTAGLPVRTVQQALMRYRNGRMRERVAAVAGWLTVLPSTRRCQDDLTPGPAQEAPALCVRDTALLDTPAPLFALTDGGIERVRVPELHLRPQALPGVPIRTLAGRQYRGLDPRLEPVPVVVVGSFDDPRLPACHADGRHCERFAIERIAWIDGAWQDRRPVETVAAADDGPTARDRRRIAGTAVAGGGAVLSELLVPRSALGDVDSAADALLGKNDTAAVWYVRVLVRRTGPGGSYPRDVGWVVIDDATGRVLAADPASATVADVR